VVLPPCLGSRFSNAADWTKRWSADIGAAAAFYVANTTAGVLAAACRLGDVLGVQSGALIDGLVHDFLSCLKQRVAEEPP
jgi:hypothetical protein